MKFVKRLTNPSDDNKCYLRLSKGYNKCVQGKSEPEVWRLLYPLYDG